ncbi:SgcJ/EcaC family oxidoreductase [Phytoactinopolyspora halotolerans]|uniref:SgcJ/EcaC family oxidoreductase n=1 Tax=Phytoactinopolyspora halotolerans TaxID=1981512 RepID=A0A6L9SG91_9ACTN|nr:SgcJ/EcaC family oxidoreductase [Phytoactinopolyspora halotolerans]NEE04153.1 SgcJ/EcaC family oxidoreductase [Phytoactinopolyspora halotolerans]
MGPDIGGVPAAQADVDAIVELVAKVEHAQQNALPDEFMDLFHVDAVWTTAHGKRLTGIDEISAFTHRVLPGALEQEITAAYEAEHMLFIRPDVAAVKVRQVPICRNGRPVDLAAVQSPEELVAHQPDKVPGAPLYVLAKETGRWKIVAAQNTKVIDLETFSAMRVLVIGATGYIGSAVHEHLSATCDVVSFVRNEATSALPGQVWRGDLTEPSTLTSAITDDIDAVVYAAAPIDETTDTNAMNALITALRGTGRPLLYTSGVWVLGPSGPDPVDEAAKPNPSTSSAIGLGSNTSSWEPAPRESAAPSSDPASCTAGMAVFPPS